VVQLEDERYYIAGPDLEGKHHKLKRGAKILIGRTKISRTSRTKYAEVEVLQQGDWASVDYSTLPCITTASGSKKQISESQYKETKLGKRMIYLLDNGVVFRCKKRGMENLFKTDTVL